MKPPFGYKPIGRVISPGEGSVVLAQVLKGPEGPLVVPLPNVRANFGPVGYRLRDDAVSEFRFDGIDRRPGEVGIVARDDLLAWAEREYDRPTNRQVPRYPVKRWEQGAARAAGDGPRSR